MEEKTVVFQIEDIAIEAYVDEDRPEIVRPGIYEVIVGRDSQTELLSAKVTW